MRDAVPRLLKHQARCGPAAGSGDPEMQPRADSLLRLLGNFHNRSESASAGGLPAWRMRLQPARGGPEATARHVVELQRREEHVELIAGIGTLRARKKRPEWAPGRLRRPASCLRAAPSRSSQTRFL